MENVRIIAISGRSQDQDRQRALSAGCEDYHVKPLDPSLLEQMLAKPLGAAEL
jgi:CheY-like chemotaxis protein